MILESNAELDDFLLVLDAATHWLHQGEQEATRLPAGEHDALESAIDNQYARIKDNTDTVSVRVDLLARLASNSWYLWEEWESMPLKKIGVERIYQDWQAAWKIIEQWEKKQEPRESTATKPQAQQGCTDAKEGSTNVQGPSST